MSQRQTDSLDEAVADVPVSELRKNFNQTGGFLNSMLDRALREKVKDKSGPKQRTDVKRYGMPSIINKPKESVLRTARAVEAEKV